MTRAQAEEVLAVGRAEIAAWVQKLTPTAGQNASVEGGTVSFMKQPVPERTVPESTWAWRLFATADRTLKGEGFENTEVVDAGSIARVARDTLALTKEDISTLTQMFDIPQTDPPEANLQRYFTLHLTARGIEPPDPVDVTSGFTPPDSVITFEEYDYTLPFPQEALRTHVMTLRNGTASEDFRSATTDQFTALRIASVTRANT